MQTVQRNASEKARRGLRVRTTPTPGHVAPRRGGPHSDPFCKQQVTVWTPDDPPKDYGPPNGALKAVPVCLDINYLATISLITKLIEI